MALSALYVRKGKKKRSSCGTFHVEVDANTKTKLLASINCPDLQRMIRKAVEFDLILCT